MLSIGILSLIQIIIHVVKLDLIETKIQLLFTQIKNFLMAFYRTLQFHLTQMNGIKLIENYLKLFGKIKTLPNTGHTTLARNQCCGSVFS